MSEIVQPLFNVLVAFAVVGYVFAKRSALSVYVPFWTVLAPSLLIATLEAENVVAVLVTYNHALIHRFLFLLLVLSFLALAWALPPVADLRRGEER